MKPPPRSGPRPPRVAVKVVFDSTYNAEVIERLVHRALGKRHVLAKLVRPRVESLPLVARGLLLERPDEHVILVVDGRDDPEARRRAIACPFEEVSGCEFWHTFVIIPSLEELVQSVGELDELVRDPQIEPIIRVVERGVASTVR